MERNDLGSTLLDIGEPVLQDTRDLTVQALPHRSGQLFVCRVAQQRVAERETLARADTSARKKSRTPQLGEI
ncbi:MAG: hypothetical protein ACRDL7_05185, partial [Gaiellaceae bacterium]